MILTLANQKGGVGKTTLAINLACLMSEIAKQSVTILDLDPQESATTWTQVGGLPVHTIKEGNPKALTAECVIIDTPGNLHAVTTQKAIQAADIVLIPCSSSPQDINPTKRTIELVKKLTHSPCLLVLNRIRDGTITARAANEWSQSLGIAVANTRIKARQIFEQTVCHGWISHGVACMELQQVLIEILNIARSKKDLNEEEYLKSE